MTTHSLNRTSLASGALILALMIFASIAQAQTNACQNSGNTRTGILEATLDGTMVTTSNKLTIATPGGTANFWSLTHSSDPRDNSQTTDPVLTTVGSTVAITVPANKAALVWLDIKAPTGAPPNTATKATKIRIETDLVDGSYQPAAPSLLVLSNGYRTVGSTKKHYEVIFCIDNSANTKTHSWNFGLKIGSVWYDPQIKNEGSGPLPLPE